MQLIGWRKVKTVAAVDARSDHRPEMEGDEDDACV